MAGRSLHTCAFGFQVQSQVVGFDVFTCDAQQRRLVVEGLNAEDGVQITLPVTEKVSFLILIFMFSIMCV